MMAKMAATSSASMTIGASTLLPLLRGSGLGSDRVLFVEHVVRQAECVFNVLQRFAQQRPEVAAVGDQGSDAIVDTVVSECLIDPLQLLRCDVGAHRGTLERAART